MGSRNISKAFNDGSQFQALIKNLPESAVVLGYGSGVFKQSGAIGGESPLIDLLVLTDSTEDYLGQLRARRMIPNSAIFGQRLTRPIIPFFADIPIAPRVGAKVGVVEWSSAIRVLRDWDSSFYLPGRLQKPVKLLHADSSDRADVFRSAQKHNHCAALIAGILTLPPDQQSSFSLETLFQSIVSLSYMGDIRVGLAENPHKIRNIVSAQLDELKEIYDPLFEYAGIASAGSGSYRNSYNPKDLWDLLPVEFKRHSIQRVDRRESVISTIAQINRRESLHQAVAGLATTGFSKSFRYLARKVSKRFII